LFDDVSKFLVDRIKNYLREKKIRQDIINVAFSSLGIDNILKMYNKSFALNKIINKETGQDIISSYKRASNILEQELKNNEIELSNSVDPALFKNDYEKNLYKQIDDLRKYFTNVKIDEDYDYTLENLANHKSVIFNFFDNVIVNDVDKVIKKNRLELIKMLCRTFDNYLNFSKIESM
jgi:glycyl-tRNA synthetase beta chain